MQSRMRDGVSSSFRSHPRDLDARSGAATFVEALSRPQAFRPVTHGRIFTVVSAESFQVGS